MDQRLCGHMFSVLLGLYLELELLVHVVMRALNVLKTQRSELVKGTDGENRLLYLSCLTRYIFVVCRYFISGGKDRGERQGTQKETQKHRFRLQSETQNAWMCVYFLTI